jgi:predicted nucleic acid-binding protein
VGRLTHLLDNSAYARLGHPTIGRLFLELQESGKIGRCGAFELEALFGARSPRQVHGQLVRALPLVATHQADFDRAAEVMLLLGDTGRHRAVGAGDLVLAAVAERADLTVLHYDRDFEHIARVTGQPMEAVAPLGSL